MSILAFIATASQGGASSTEINSVAISANALTTCIGGGWMTDWLATLSQTLLGDEELYWEVATNSAGNNWTYHSRGVSLTVEQDDITLGSNGTGSSDTQYIRMRAYVVPVGEAVGEAVSGPATATQASRTAALCEEA